MRNPALAGPIVEAHRYRLTSIPHAPRVTLSKLTGDRNQAAKEPAGNPDSSRRVIDLIASVSLWRDFPATTDIERLAGKA